MKDTTRQLLTGNEAIARGAYEAGVTVCSAYPGTPSTEIFENLAQYRDVLYAEWAPNEKVATEVAYGASIELTGGPQGALVFFSVFYLSCVLVTWRWYSRKEAEVPC